MRWKIRKKAFLHFCPPSTSWPVIYTCPPYYIFQATKHFNAVIREGLETIVGGPISEWCWLKASLPSSQGGINLRSGYRPATSSCCKALVGELLGEPAGKSRNIGRSSLVAVCTSASHPDWCSWRILMFLCSSNISQGPFTMHCKFSCLPLLHPFDLGL